MSIELNLVRKEKQHYQELGYEEVDYQQVVSLMEAFTEQYKKLEDVYSVRSINEMFLRYDKENPDPRDKE